MAPESPPWRLQRERQIFETFEVFRCFFMMGGPFAGLGQDFSLTFAVVSMFLRCLFPHCFEVRGFSTFFEVGGSSRFGSSLRRPRGSRSAAGCLKRASGIRELRRGPKTPTSTSTTTTTTTSTSSSSSVARSVPYAASSPSQGARRRHAQRRGIRRRPEVSVVIVVVVVLIIDVDADDVVVVDVVVVERRRRRRLFLLPFWRPSSPQLGAAR